MRRVESMRTAIGLIAGPESPAVTLAIRGCEIRIDCHRREGIDQREGVGASLWAT